MNGDFLRFQSYGEDPLEEVVNVSTHQQFANNSQFDQKQNKEQHNDQMANMMLKIGRDMNKQNKKPQMGSKLAFSHQVSGSHNE